ncbi:MAG TPA: SPOR domain-containing protein, partial [Rhodocyclaceae bacterium]|nr:SPOR domain-containing protein [Rhodocyclaceae bacterium]
PAPAPAPAPAPRAEEVPATPARIEEVAVESPATPPEQATDADRSFVCIAYAGLDETDAKTLERIGRDLSPDIRTSLQMIDPPSAWWVRIPPAASRQAAERKVTELRGLGITDLFIVREPGPNQNAISLGLFRTESSARQHLADLETRRVRGAEIAARNPAVYQIEVAGPASVLTLLAERLASDLPNARRGECNP